MGAVFLARYLRDRADRRSAARLAIGLAIAEIVGRILGLHHVATPDVELRRLLTALVNPTFDGAFVWVFYLAIEPYARRLWPDGLLGWTRLLSGHVRDARVGHDVLVGLTFAEAWLLVSFVGRTVRGPLGYTAGPPPFGQAVSMLLGASTVFPRWAVWLNEALQEFTVFRDRRWQGNIYMKLADLYDELGSYDEAYAALAQAVQRFTSRDDAPRLATAILSFADLERRNGRTLSALWWSAAAETMFGALNMDARRDTARLLAATLHVDSADAATLQVPPIESVPAQDAGKWRLVRAKLALTLGRRTMLAPS